MNKKTKGLLAGAAGAAILLGGSTFALWSDSASADGGEITAGNLDVAFVGTPSWKDVSDDRSDNAHKIDLDDFRIVPGDSIAGTFKIDAALEGDNLVAELGLAAGDEASGELLKRLEISYSVTHPGGAEDDVDFDKTVELLFASFDNSHNTPDLPTLPASLDGDADLTVVVTVTFDENTSEQDRVQATAALGELSVDLIQTRTPADGAGGYNP